MTHVKFNQRPAERKMNALFEDFFNQFPGKFLHDGVPSAFSVPVNIRETEKSYLLEVIAPGLEKTDFKVNVDQNILTISGEKKTETPSAQERLVRREFTAKTFKRSFTLDESINSESIFAKYENGVLFVELPKKEEAKAQPKEISIQ